MKKITYILFSIIIMCSFQVMSQHKSANVTKSLPENKYQMILDKSLQIARHYSRQMENLVTENQESLRQLYIQDIIKLFENKESEVVYDEISNSVKSIDRFLFLLKNSLPPENHEIEYTIHDPYVIQYNIKRDVYYVPVNVQKNIRKNSESFIDIQKIIVIKVTDIHSSNPNFFIYNIRNDTGEDLPGVVVDIELSDQDIFSAGSGGSPETSQNNDKLSDRERSQIRKDQPFNKISPFKFILYTDVFSRGKVHQVDWIGGGNKVDLYYWPVGSKEKQSNHRMIVENYTNDQQFKWNIPKSMKPGKYEFGLKGDDMEMQVSKTFRIKRKIPLVLKIAVPIALGVVLATQIQTTEPPPANELPDPRPLN